MTKAKEKDTDTEQPDTRAKGAMVGNATPAVGRVVHYYDREECVNAEFAGRTPEPFGARITRVHKGDDGVLDVVTLAVDDPELGHQVKRDVHLGADVSRPEANRWYWPPYVPAKGATTNRLTLDNPPGQNSEGGAPAVQ